MISEDRLKKLTTLPLSGNGELSPRSWSETNDVGKLASLDHGFCLPHSFSARDLGLDFNDNDDHNLNNFNFCRFTMKPVRSGQY